MAVLKLIIGVKVVIFVSDKSLIENWDHIMGFKAKAMMETEFAALADLSSCLSKTTRSVD